MRIQFSLRFTLLLMAFFALLLAPLTNYVLRVRRQVRVQNAAVAKLENAGAQLSSGALKPDAADPAVAFARKWIESTAKEARRTAELSPRGKRLSPSEADDQLTALGDVHGVETISLRVETITPQILDRLLKFPRLNSLNLEADSLEPPAAQRFSQLHSVRNLHLLCPSSDILAEAIAKLPQLSQLTIDASQLTSSGQESIASCPHLTSLTITGSLLGPRLFADLAGRSKLASLHLWKCSLDQEATTALGGARSVVSFNFHGKSEAHGDITQSLSKLPQLTRLLFRPEAKALTSPELKQLATCTQLTELDLTYTVLNEAQLLAFANCNKLKTIKFRGELADAAIEAYLSAQPKGVKAIQLTTTDVAMVGQSFQMVKGTMVIEDYPGEVTMLTSGED